MGDGQQMYMCMSVCVGFCLYELTYALSLLSESTLLEGFHVAHLFSFFVSSLYHSIGYLHLCVFNKLPPLFPAALVCVCKWFLWTDPV